MSWICHVVFPGALAVASLTVSVGAAAVAEFMIAARNRRRVMRNSTARSREGIAGDGFAAPAARGGVTDHGGGACGALRCQVTASASSWRRHLHSRLFLGFIGAIGHLLLRTPQLRSPPAGSGDDRHRIPAGSAAGRRPGTRPPRQSGKRRQRCNCRTWWRCHACREAVCPRPMSFTIARQSVLTTRKPTNRDDHAATATLDCACQGWLSL